VLKRFHLALIKLLYELSMSIIGGKIMDRCDLNVVKLVSDQQVVASLAQLVVLFVINSFKHVLGQRGRQIEQAFLCGQLVNVVDEVLAASTPVSIILAVDLKAGRVHLLDGILLFFVFALDLKRLRHVLNDLLVSKAILFLVLL